MIYGSTVSQLHSTVFSRERQSFLFVRHEWNDDSFSLDEKSLFPIRSKTNKISNNRTNGIGLLLYFYFGLLIVLTRQRFASLLTSIVPTLTVNNNETKIIISFLRSFAKTNYRIYSRISREILDEFWTVVFQFDLYAGHKSRQFSSGGWQGGRRREKGWR
jgi:hypothetical protein